MALQLAFTDRTRTLHPEAYWRIAQIGIDATSMRADVVVVAYHDAAAADRKDPAMPCGQRLYAIEGAEFLALASSAAQGSVWSSIASACYKTIKARKDVPVPGEPNEEPRSVAFFAGAKDV